VAHRREARDLVYTALLDADVVTGFNVHLVKPVRPGKVHDTILGLLAA
jgi:hypothetical protein